MIDQLDKQLIQLQNALDRIPRVIAGYRHRIDWHQRQIDGAEIVLNNIYLTTITEDHRAKLY